VALGISIALVALELLVVAPVPAHAATTVHLVPIATNFNQPIGVDFHETQNKLLLSVNYPSGSPNNFDLVATDGSHSPFTTVSGLTNEVYISTVRTSACEGGFTVGQSFVGTGTPGVIARISPDGGTITNPWVTLPGENGLLRGGLFQDRYCSFNGDLIVTTETGHVWRVTSGGTPTLVATVGQILEGPTTIPNDPKYGPWAGTILVGDEAAGLWYSITTAGRFTSYPFGHGGGSGPESARIITAGENFFGVDFADGALVVGPAAQFSGIVGDLALANEDGSLQHAVWNPGTSTFDVEQIAKVGQFEGTTFAPISLPTTNVTLTPPTATNLVFTDHTVTATVSKSGKPQAGKTVTFSVLSGPNTGVSGTQTTDANGQATFTYHDSGGAGTDTIQVSFTDDFGTVETATATKAWVLASPTLTTQASGSVPAGGKISDTATLTGGAAPSGTITFKLFGPGDPTCNNGAIATFMQTVSGNGSYGSGNAVAGVAGTYHWVASYSGDASNNPASTLCGDPGESVTLTAQVLTGRAFGLSANASLLGLTLVNIPPIPDTGPVSTTVPSTTSTPCVASIGGLITAHVLCANVTTSLGPAKSTATASVNDTSILGLPGVPGISIGLVQSSSTTTCAGSSGTTTIAFLQVGGTVVIAKPTAIAPNTTINVGVVSLVLNEQIPVTGPDKGLTVNAVHIKVNALGAAKVDMILASSESDIGNCP